MCCEMYLQKPNLLFNGCYMEIKVTVIGIAVTEDNNIFPVRSKKPYFLFSDILLLVPQ